MKAFDTLCKPAKFYFVLSILLYVIHLLQNVGNMSQFSMGTYSCPHAYTGVILLCELLYIVGFTWLLNLLCSVSKTLSWVIVLMPFLVQCLALGLILFYGMKAEGFRIGNGGMFQATL